MLTSVAPSQKSLLRIGELAQASQVSIKTIRYYEKLGLLHAKTRTEGGFRLFTPEQLSRLDFIKRSQRLGLSLREITQLLNIYDEGQPPCTEVTKTLTSKIAAIDQHIAELQTLKAQLTMLLQQSTQPSESTAEVICPIIQPTSTR